MTTSNKNNGQSEIIRSMIETFGPIDEEILKKSDYPNSYDYYYHVLEKAIKEQTVTDDK